MFENQNDDTLEVLMVLDRSGSMNRIREQAVEAFNEQVETIREKINEDGSDDSVWGKSNGSANSTDLDANVSLVTFSTNPDEPKLWRESVSRLEELPYSEYQPNGYTALYDTVGKSVERLRDEADSDSKYLVVVVTDGRENNSEEFTPENNRLQELIQSLQDKDNWTFVYLGGGQEVDLAEIKELGIPEGNVRRFARTAKGAKRASASLSTSTGNYIRRVQCANTSDSSDEFFADGDDSGLDSE